MLLTSWYYLWRGRCSTVLLYLDLDGSSNNLYCGLMTSCTTSENRMHILCWWSARDVPFSKLRVSDVILYDSCPSSVRWIIYSIMLVFSHMVITIVILIIIKQNSQGLTSSSNHTINVGSMYWESHPSSLLRTCRLNPSFTNYLRQRYYSFSSVGL